MIELNNGNEVAEGNLEVRVDNAQRIGVAEKRNSSVLSKRYSAELCGLLFLQYTDNNR